MTFTIFRSREHLSTPRHNHHVPGAVGGIGSQQYISKRMSVGVDLVTCCQPCICRDGDSIQVGNIMPYYENFSCGCHKTQTSTSNRTTLSIFVSGYNIKIALLALTMKIMIIPGYPCIRYIAAIISRALNTHKSYLAYLAAHQIGFVML